MKKIMHVWMGIFLFLSLFILFHFYTKNDYQHHLEKKKQQANTINSLPSDFLQILSFGHKKSVADFLWILLIQHIGNNPENSYNEKTFSLINQINSLSKYFERGYEWALWVMPIPQNSQLEYDEKNKKKLERPLQIAYNGMKYLCDTPTLEKISQLSLTPNTWQHESLKNPCKNGMLPYLIAFYGGQLTGKNTIAQKFYTIAGFQDDAPSVSQILALISSAPKDTPTPIARNFAIMAMGWFDQKPYFCQDFSKNLLQILHKKSLEKADIKWIIENQERLHSPKNTGHFSGQTCFGMLDRAIKYSYLAFVNQISKQFPEIDTIENLLPKMGLSKVPQSPSQEKMTLIRENSTWKYAPLP